MKKSFVTLAAIAASLLGSISAATPEQEKTFVESYRKALEAGDAEKLASFLYTKGAEEETVGFFKAMQMLDPGSKIVSIELITPDAETAAKLNKPMTMPDGKQYEMPIKPIKQLVVKTETKDANGSGSSTSKSPVAEKDGKLVIPVPVPSKK